MLIFRLGIGIKCMVHLCLIFTQNPICCELGLCPNFGFGYAPCTSKGILAALLRYLYVYLSTPLCLGTRKVKVLTYRLTIRRPS